MATIIVVSSKNHKLIIKVVNKCLLNRTFTWCQSILIKGYLLITKEINSDSQVRNLDDLALMASCLLMCCHGKHTSLPGSLSRNIIRQIPTEGCSMK